MTESRSVSVQVQVSSGVGFSVCCELLHLCFSFLVFWACLFAAAAAAILVLKPCEDGEDVTEIKDVCGV